MAKRFTDTELWDKAWFMELKPKLKCLVKLIRDKCDLCGVWNINWVLANEYVGERVTESELLKIDGGKQFVKISENKIYCLGFIEFQYGNLSEKSPVHRKIIGMLENHQIDYKHPINRVQDKEEEKEEEVDKEKEKEKDGGEFEVFISDFNEIMGKRYSGTQKAHEHFKARSKEGYTRQDFQTAIRSCMADDHHIKSSYKWLTPEFITRADQLEKWLNFQRFEVINPAFKPMTETEKRIANLEIQKQEALRAEQEQLNQKSAS